MSDERLAWLAVCDQVSRRARRGSLLARWLGVDRRSARIMRDGKLFDTGGRVNEIVGDKMADYALAVGEVTGRLSADERRALRETGAVPDWFLAEVEDHVVILRQQR